jgi:hypothetical protein
MVSTISLMEAENISETSVNFRQTTRRVNPEDSHLHVCRRENVKSPDVLHCFLIYVNYAFRAKETTWTL